MAVCSNQFGLSWLLKLLYYPFTNHPFTTHQFYLLGRALQRQIGDRPLIFTFPYTANPPNDQISTVHLRPILTILGICQTYCSVGIPVLL